MTIDSTAMRAFGDALAWEHDNPESVLPTFAAHDMIRGLLAERDEGDRPDHVAEAAALHWRLRLLGYCTGSWAVAASVTTPGAGMTRVRRCAALRAGSREGRARPCYSEGQGASTPLACPPRACATTQQVRVVFGKHRRACARCGWG